MNVSQTVEALIRIFEEEQSASKEGAHFTVSRTVSTLAVLYEKARNAVEFRAEHLVRRAAIERILKRRFIISGGGSETAESLVTELLWARYIDSSFIDDEKVAEIQHIIHRYALVKYELYASASVYDSIPWDTMMGFASSEIEETIVSARKREALNDFLYQAIRPKISIPTSDERTVNMQAYIAVERAFAQADDALIGYHVLKIIQPAWFTQESQDIKKDIPLLIQNIHLIQSSLRDPVGEALYRYVRRQTPAFLLIRDFFLEVNGQARTLIEDTQKFEQKLAELAAKRYQEIGAKVRRSVVRSFIYIFLTKMVFALALEAPFDLFIAKKIAYIPLTINTLFPPVLLFMVAGLFSVPGSENTRKLIERISKIIYHFNELQKEHDIFTPKTHERRPVLTAVFSIIYLVTFLIVFGLISFLLTKLHFNIASQIIFVFFVTLVSFFAYRIRQSAKEYDMGDRQGFLEPLFDFFFLPVLRAGHVLSREIARLNVLIFFFDFILEAPLKVIFEVVEEWIRFIRTKKEEIV